ncbi:TIGR01777 family oxidoreductase [Xanthomarina sp. F1114]|uniref:TIGR01777 family oxidoreductase n=1 Tax=Xanthomarina sp. F1114 TaxID=2996019 RepID=UPI00225E2F28|nr:TIGR01777 family oxidoreductase [Xanthomarina sp. F1114]MCX7547901.1 TIGR01777 family oxidoreductase [Xanthomarina sp. F1114]
MKTIIIAGGTGFLGQILEKHFSSKGYFIKTLTRKPIKKNDIYWDAKSLGNWTRELENTYALINLTGKSVDCRYTEKNKKLIYNSRIDSTQILGVAINLCDNPPIIWLNSSTATIYKDSINKKMDEEHGDIGDDFSMNIAKSWEKSFYAIKNTRTRKIALRTAIVLGRAGGALTPLKRLTKLGLGGYQGNGNQKVSWIHQEDFARAVEYLMNHESLEGNFNLCVPKPTDNKTLMRGLRNVLDVPIGINHPVWLLNFGAKLIGTETELVLKSRNVIPKRLLETQFKFKFTNIEEALSNLIKT